jgi:cellulose synthase/poly-beta-1,6-N-acetylglucosamine synthase-like glycosyltransferase
VPIFISILEYTLLAYFIYVGIYTFMFGIASIFYKSPQYPKTIKQSKFVVLIPAYKEDGVIISVAEDALKQNYPSENYDVVVIADSLQKSTLAILHSLPIKCIEVSFEKSTKVKALNVALEQLGDSYDFAVILDADNLMEQDFLSKMEVLHLKKSLKAIQGQRASKNDNSILSFLDGLSENINNNIYGKGSVTLSMSASLKGSGMSFEYDLLKSHLRDMSSIGGFDRELELRLVRQGFKVFYAHNAVVKDEKVEKSEVFENQRKRWISSQYYYLKKFFWTGMAALFKGQFTLFNSTVFRNIQLPRLINIGLINILAVCSFFFYSNYGISHFYLWLLCLLLIDIGVMLSISRPYYSWRLVSSILSLPFIFLKMIILLFRLKGSNKKFIHTPHGSNESEKK